MSNYFASEFSIYRNNQHIFKVEVIASITNDNDGSGRYFPDYFELDEIEKVYLVRYCTSPSKEEIPHFAMDVEERTNSKGEVYFFWKHYKEVNSIAIERELWDDINEWLSEQY